MHGNVELLERLHAEHLDEVPASTLGWPGTSKIHFSGYSVVSWPPSSGSESMMRESASRMPAQNAVHMPTGPAPITVMSRTSSKSWGAATGSVVMADLGERQCGPVERAERALDRARDAGERRRVAQRVGARLGRAQPLHEIEEVGRVVGLEGDHELLVVEPERVARVEVDGRELAADLDVLLHDPPALVGRQARTRLGSSRTGRRTGTSHVRVEPQGATHPSTRTAWSWPGTNTAPCTTSSGRSGPAPRGTRGSARGSGPG